MENASNALIIAGGILIAIIILTITVFLFSNFARIGAKYERTMQANEVQKFNVNFKKFENRDDITIQEIVTLANYVREFNTENGTTIEVKLVPEKLEEKNSEDLTDIVKDNLNKEFKATLGESNSQGLIKSIAFQETTI